MDSNTTSKPNSFLSDTTFKKFLIIEDPSNKLTKVSPFAIAKASQDVAGIPNQLKRLQSGQFFIEVSLPAHSKNLLKTKSLADIPVNITPHKTLNPERNPR